METPGLFVGTVAYRAVAARRRAAQGGWRAFDLLGVCRHKRGMMILASIALMISGGYGANAANARPICTSADATPTRLEVVLADTASWQGRCVRIMGIVSGARLYANRAALADWADGPWDGDARRSIQLYRGRRVLVRSPAWRVVIGTIDSCVREHEAVEGLHRADSESYIMVGGFCHTSLAPYFTPTAIRRASRRGAS